MKKKGNLKRFLLNRYVAYVTWAMMFLPVLFLVTNIEKKSDGPFYQIAIVVFVVGLAFYLSGGKTVIVNGRKSAKRYKYRYIILNATIFFACMLCSLLDFYFYRDDYFQDVVAVSLFYTLFTLPVAIMRTYHSRCLDLLDVYYCKYEDNPLIFSLVLIIGFYICMVVSIYLCDLMGVKKILFNSNILPFIVITMVEFVLFLICYFSYILYKKSRNENIYYK